MTRTGLAIRILLLAAGMVVVAFLSAWVAFTFLTQGGEVTVPALEGVELRAALELASRDQLGLRVKGTGYDLGTPPGHVISQDPLPGTKIKANRIVYVVVSQGTPSVFIPNLTNLTLRKAELQLAQAGLTLGKIGRTHVEEVLPGLVITQSPPPGQFVPRSDSINLLLSDGPRPAVYLLPDMTGLPMETVLSRIRDWNMRSGRIMEIVDEKVPPGTVAALTPPPGSAVVEGQSIHLTVTKMQGPAEPSQVILYHHTVPFGLLDRTLTLVLEINGNERTVWEDTIGPGSSVSIPVVVSSPGVLKVYVDEVFLEERKVP
ncbi:MAG: PASTA domain-containing protein [bacterium]|nr:PASTA domain-containing protein [bacterium]MDT8365824.1 PASTA domain-containing protein [bacterium]